MVTCYHNTLLAVAITEMFHYAAALRLDNRKVFGCIGCKVSLVVFISRTLDHQNAS